MKLLKNLSFTALAAVIVLLMAASLVEKLTGSAADIYGSWWFAIAWAILTVVGIAYCLRRRLQRRPFTLLLHLALATILLGALVTHIWGQQGMLHLRKGVPMSSFLTDEQQVVRLPFTLRLDDFEIMCDPGTTTHSDYRSTVSVSRATASNEQQAVISMNRIGQFDGYRLYQSSYDSDLHGSVLAVSHDPWGIGITYTGYGLLFVSMLLLLVLPNEGLRLTLRHSTRGQRRWALALVLTAIGIALFVVSRIYAKPLQPVLRSAYLGIHVGIIVVAYTLLAADVVLGIVGLCLRQDEKRRRLMTLSRILLMPALFCLAAGIFIGAIWANVSWGRYWGWDPKEVWALVTMLVYAFAFHGESLPALRKPRPYHAFMVLAFLTVLITYFGVNILLGGLHSYANG